MCSGLDHNDMVPLWYREIKKLLNHLQSGRWYTFRLKMTFQNSILPLFIKTLFNLSIIVSMLFFSVFIHRVFIIKWYHRYNLLIYF